ncbi:MAG: NAD-dependent deacylase [Mariniblastus sp.]|nr:NAD-dependent deacylase [Mariniblastus sp.]
MTLSDIHDPPEKIQAVVEGLRQSKSVMVITGAGLSADSGLPTYRGLGGLYNDKTTEDGLAIEEALSGPVFAEKPNITWKYLHQIEAACRCARFNRGHQVLAEMEHHFDRFLILTQNIDGFHTQAGSANVIEIHGNLYTIVCTGCQHQFSVDDYGELATPPLCERCGATLRPQVVLFEERLPEKAIQQLDQAMQRSFDSVITIGTSSHFPYILQPLILAHQNGDFTVEINPTQTKASEWVDEKLSSPAAATLDRIWSQLQES